MIRSFIKKIFRFFGLDVQRSKNSIYNPGPVGSMEVLLRSLRDRGLKCGAIMDVGANQTQWSQTASTIFPESWFFLIEPLEEYKPLLLEFSIYHEKVKSFDVALGAETGEKTFTIWDDLDGSSFLPPADKKLLKEEKQRVVHMTTIDQLMDDFDLEIPEIVKIDVQGYELEVLKGASNIIGETEVFILEVSMFPFDDLPDVPVFDEVYEFMKEKGYVVYDFGGFHRRPLDGALGQCDVCFVLKDSFLREDSRWRN